RALVAAVRAAVLDSRRALQLPSRLLDGVEQTVRRMLEHFKSDGVLLLDVWRLPRFVCVP
ncbi:hypothetical protein, partial [Streptomyces sp. RK62]|uniref:hypothetical protein n=1 Tax=Streptomyces sp. RK62 TaxID=2824893 RepID=UPI001B360767